VTVIPYPVFPEAVKPGRFWFSRAGASVIVIEYVKYLGALVRPLFQSHPGAPTSP